MFIWKFPEMGISQKQQSVGFLKSIKYVQFRMILKSPGIRESPMHPPEIEHGKLGR
jgi:hypothetical protein